MVMGKFYGEDLAYIHDAGFGDFARSAAGAVLKLLEEEGIGEGLIVELGSGSGIFAGKLTAKGYNVLGVDYSEDMVKIARKRAPGGVFEVGSIFDFSIPPCRAVVSIGECLSYALDEKNSMEALGEVFSRAYDCLGKGGFFVFDILEPGVNGGEKELYGIKEGKDWTIFLKRVEDMTKSTYRREITIFRREGELYRRSREVHTANLYRRGEIEKMLKEKGFKVTLTDHYGERVFEKGHIGFICRK